MWSGRKGSLHFIPVVGLASDVGTIVGTIEEFHVAHKIMDEVDHLVLEQAPGIQIERHLFDNERHFFEKK
jgi:hypothetical protein